MKLNIVSYNIHKGFAPFNLTFGISDIREMIRSLNSDLVFLQEIHGEHLAHGNQLEFLADQIWNYAAYGKNAAYTEGNHGNAILSKFPISFQKNLNISTNSLEKRGVLHTQIPLPHSSESLHAICLHLSLFGRGRKNQIDMLCNYIEENISPSAPLILAGDFNDWSEILTPVLTQRLQLSEVGLLSNGAHLKTFPSWMPILGLDRVYFRNLNLLAHEVHRKEPWKKLSDHLAVSAHFDLP